MYLLKNVFLNWVQDNEEQLHNFVLQRYIGDKNKNKQQKQYGNIILLVPVKSPGLATTYHSDTLREVSSWAAIHAMTNRKKARHVLLFRFCPNFGC